MAVMMMLGGSVSSEKLDLVRNSITVYLCAERTQG